jgi:hypothetical protein
MHSQPSWWISNLAIPAFFTSLGFFFGEIKDWLQSHRSKRAFLAAITIEVAALKTALERRAKRREFSKKNSRSRDTLHSWACSG